ncbi:hypothetical protein C8F01DRAFT_1253047 [Mycena amicta]|nr:hypothetical protein C8F01DRAFT_1253047 [Mycena amicta]
MLDLSTPSLPANANANAGIAQMKLTEVLPVPPVRSIFDSQSGEDDGRLVPHGQGHLPVPANDHTHGTNDQRLSRATHSFALFLSRFICMRRDAASPSPFVIPCGREKVGAATGIEPTDAKREGGTGWDGGRWSHRPRF